MKRRSEAEGEDRGGSGELRILWKTFLTCEGSGKVVIVTSYPLCEHSSRRFG